MSGIGARVVEAALIGMLSAAASAYVAQARMGAQLEQMEKRLDRIEGAVYRPAWERERGQMLPGGSGASHNGADLAADRIRAFTPEN